MLQEIIDVRSLAAQFQLANPCCIKVIPYLNEDEKSLRVCLNVDTNGNGIPPDVEKSAKEMFPSCEIKCVDLQRRPLSKIVARLPPCKKQKEKEILRLFRIIEDNLGVFENRLNVTAVWASYKVVKGVEQEIPCITVCVLGKGDIPVHETEIKTIKESNGDLFRDVVFDVVEGYNRPAWGPAPWSQMAYAPILNSGIGIGVEGVYGAGTLGPFLEDEDGECYILSCEHVLNPPKSEDDTNKDRFIEQPAQSDYKLSLDKAKNDLEDIQTEHPEYLELQLADEDHQDEYFQRTFTKWKKKETNAKEVIDEIENYKPRRIAHYSAGLMGNVKIDGLTDEKGNPCKFFGDAAIAKVDKKELNFVTEQKAKSKSNRCVVYGFDKVTDFVPTGEIVDLETFLKEIREDPDKDLEDQLTFVKIGRTTGVTDNGRIDASLPRVFVNGTSFPSEKLCAPASTHTSIPCCINCRTSDISEAKLVECDKQKCPKCHKELKKGEIYSLWKLNCFGIRKVGKPFTEEGDSGSVIFDNHGRAFGLQHSNMIVDGGNADITLVSPLSVVLKALEEKCGKKLKLWCVKPAANEMDV